MLSPTVYSVAQVAVYLKEKLESDSLLSSLTVQGEVANLRTVASGHSYFTLRGDGSSIRCVMFRGRSGQEYLDEGQEILAGGTFTFYAPSGEANLQVVAALPVGEGALALELARLRQALQSEGLFDPSRKRPLPLFPRMVGVVTSPSGAVWQDIQNVVRRRYSLTQLRLCPSAVQGEAAAGQIASAITRLNSESMVDVIIVARGGGSLEDLWCFNSEEVARAIFASKVPVVSGVGHETDYTIADDVADQRAPTPSAAAELVTPDSRQLMANVHSGRQQAAHAMNSVVTRHRNGVERLWQRLTRRAPDVGLMKRQVDDLQTRAATRVLLRNDYLKRDVSMLHARLTALEPAATLRRGYAVVNRSADGTIITHPQLVADGDPLDITVAGGVLAATAGSQADHIAQSRQEPAPAVSHIEPNLPDVHADDDALLPEPGPVAPRRQARRGRKAAPAPPPAMRPLL